MKTSREWCPPPHYGNGGMRRAGQNLKEVSMGTCEVCGNEYDKTFEVRFAGGTHVFDSFESGRVMNLHVAGRSA